MAPGDVPAPLGSCLSKRGLRCGEEHTTAGAHLINQGVSLRQPLRIAASSRNRPAPSRSEQQHAVRFCSQIPRTDTCASPPPRRRLTLPFAFSRHRVQLDREDVSLLSALCGCQCLPVT